MEDIAQGVTPAASIVPDSDPFVQQLIAEKNQLIDENNRLRARNMTLESRLARYEDTYNRIATIVLRHSGAKAIEG